MAKLITTGGAEPVTVSATQNKIHFSHNNENFDWQLSECEFVWTDGSLTVVSASASLELTGDEVLRLQDQSSFFSRYKNLKTFVKYTLGTCVALLVLLHLMLWGLRSSADLLSHKISLKQEKQWFGDSLPKSAGSDKLTALLKQFDPPPEVQVALVESEEVNAYAFPGAKILVTRKLICDSKSSEELLGVLVHELGHIVNRHSLRKGISSIGAMAIMTLLVGGDYGSHFLVNSASRTYSVADEVQADTFAKKTLDSHNISTIPLANFFERLAEASVKENGTTINKILSSFSEHPPTKERIHFFRQASAAEQNDSEENNQQKLLNSRIWMELKEDAQCAK